MKNYSFHTGCLSWLNNLMPSIFTPLLLQNKSQKEDEEDWDKKLPMNLHQIQSRITFPSDQQFSTKKEIYHFLCSRPAYIDGVSKKLWIDKTSGKTSLLISATTFDIAWGNDNRYWNWLPRNDSSFGEVARLLNACWFEVRTKFDCGLLFPGIVYTASFRIRMQNGHRGWDKGPLKCSVSTSWGEKHESACFLSDMNIRVSEDGGVIQCSHRVGEDGWMELDAGQFLVPHNGVSSSHEVVVSMMQVELLWKSGLLLDSLKIHHIP